MHAPMPGGYAALPPLAYSTAGAVGRLVPDPTESLAAIREMRAREAGVARARLAGAAVAGHDAARRPVRADDGARLADRARRLVEERLARRDRRAHGHERRLEAEAVVGHGLKRAERRRRADLRVSAAIGPTRARAARAHAPEAGRAGRRRLARLAGAGRPGRDALGDHARVGRHELAGIARVGAPALAVAGDAADAAVIAQGGGGRLDLDSARPIAADAVGRARGASVERCRRRTGARAAVTAATFECEAAMARHDREGCQRKDEPRPRAHPTPLLVRAVATPPPAPSGSVCRRRRGVPRC